MDAFDLGGGGGGGGPISCNMMHAVYKAVAVF